MPIQCCFDVEKISQPCFQEIDFRVMRIAFDLQNKVGRLCNESIYQSELLHQCAKNGMQVLAEGEIVVSFDTFMKSYYLDALINRGALYELKAVSALNGHNEAQLLNYLFLSGLRHGKLVNFSSSSVQHRFVSTSIDSSRRYSFTIDDNAWAADIPSSEKLREIVRDLLNDWGAFLDINLYREAIIHFLGGEEQLLSSVDFSVDGRFVGHQKIHLLDGSTCLHVSSTIRHRESYQKQLSRMLEHTALKQIQWVNFDRSEIHLVSLQK